MLVPGVDSVVVVLDGIDFRRLLSEVANNASAEFFAYLDATDPVERDYHKGQSDRLNGLLRNLQSQGE